MTRPHAKLGPLEMEVLGLLEGSPSRTVQQVVDALASRGRKKLAYTTIMTVLSRLYDKGFLSREKGGRQYRYSTAQGAESMRRGIWSSVYQKLFQGNRLNPIMSLIDDGEELTTEELQELKKFVDRKIKARKEP